MRTGDGGFTVNARSGGLLCFGAVSLESCFYRHIITYSSTHKLSFYGGEEYFFEEGATKVTLLYKQKLIQFLFRVNTAPAREPTNASGAILTKNHSNP